MSKESKKIVNSTSKGLVLLQSIQLKKHREILSPIKFLLKKIKPVQKVQRLLRKEEASIIPLL